MYAAYSPLLAVEGPQAKWTWNTPAYSLTDGVKPGRSEPRNATKDPVALGLPIGTQVAQSGHLPLAPWLLALVVAVQLSRAPCCKADAVTRQLAVPTVERG